MKLVKLYKSVLTEGRVEACVAQFGQELFAPQMGGEEPNTDSENDFVELARNFTGGEFGSRVNPEFIHLSERLKTCVAAYPEILFPEGVAYRGTTVTIEDLLRSFDDIKNNIRVGHSFEMIYNAKTPIQSWTSSEDIANDNFGKTNSRLSVILDKFEQAKTNGRLEDFLNYIVQDGLDGMVPIVLRYRTTPQDFIFKAKYFSYLSQNEHEDEILRVDNRPIKVEAKIYPTEFSAKLFDLLQTIDNWG